MSTVNCTETYNINCTLHYTLHCAIHYFVSVLGQDEGYMVKYTPWPEGVPKGKAQGNSGRRRGIFDNISRVEAKD